MQNKETFEFQKSREVEIRGIKMKRKPMFDESNTMLLNGVKLHFQRGLGFNQNWQIRNSAYCIDDNKIIYLLASQIVVYDMLAETQKVIDEFEYDDEVSAMLYYKNILLEDNIIYAVRNNNKSFPSLVMLNFSKNLKQEILLANLEREENIVEICLVGDFKFIGTLSRIDGVARVTIIEVLSKEIKISEIVNLQPIGMLSLQQFPTKLVLYTPTDIILINMDDGINLTQLSISKYLQSQNEKIVQISISPFSNNCIYMITDFGNLYIVYVDIINGKITTNQKYFLGNYQTLDSHGNQIQKRRKPTCLCINQYNIVIGYELLQQLTIIKISAITTKLLIKNIKYSCPYLHKIITISFAAQTMSLCIIVQVKDNDKYQFVLPVESEASINEQLGNRQALANHSLPVGKIYPIVFNLLLYDSLVQTLRSPIQMILNSTLLTKKILDICILSTKKLILILSADKKIVALKYEHLNSISFNKMVAWQIMFNACDQPNSFDVHPLTFNLVVSFKDGIKLYHIYSDGLKPTNINLSIKNCECVKYSRYGHILIVGTLNQIFLINPYQNTIKTTIQLSHGFNTRQLISIDHDMYLFGLFTNGASQVINLDGGRVFEIWNKGSKCMHSCYDPIFDIAIVSYQDNQVKFFKDKGEVQFAIMWTYPFLITKMLIVNELGTVFMGTSTGKIRAYQWPITDMLKFSKSFTQIQLHRLAITQLKITNDFCYLVSGAQDGTVFISKIIPYSDGMMVNDSSVLYTYKINKKNYNNLYYLQNVVCTNNTLQLQKEEQIAQYQSDKTDTANQSKEILQSYHTQNDKKYQNQQQQNKAQLQKQTLPLQQEVQKINRNKIQLKDELTQLLQNKYKQIQNQQQKKLNVMRELYSQNTHLKNKYLFYQQQYCDAIKQQKLIYQKQLLAYQSTMNNKENRLINDCNELQKQFYQSLTNYQQLIKQQDEQGTIYIKKMMQQLDTELSSVQQRGEQLRRGINKQHHQNRSQQQKTKYFQQLISQISTQLQTVQMRRQCLKQKIQQLDRILKQKDQQIFNQQKIVKELLKKCINNYSYQQYLKYQEEELIQNGIYCQKEICGLDGKYKEFQDQFIYVSKETNQYVEKIQNAYKIIQQLKQKQKLIKQKIAIQKYKSQQTYKTILQHFHTSESKSSFHQKLPQLLPPDSEQFSNPNQQQINENIQKRDRLINQVLNTNKLKKIYDNNKKTLMIKLNRQTANLINQVNLLRKQKKCLMIKSRDVLFLIQELQGNLYHHQRKQGNKDKENNQSLTDIIPVNISVIQSQTSKHMKSLPFQIYQQNKITQRNSIYSKINSKSIGDQSSTQLPSIIIKQSQSQGVSFVQQSILEGVKENQDQGVQ